MSHGAEIELGDTPPAPAVLRPLQTVLDAIDRLLMAVCGLCLLAAALVFCHSVLTRYVLEMATDWQDEMATFLIVGGTLLPLGAVQARRGHVAIHAFDGMFGPRVEWMRLALVDLVTTIFCVMFAWLCIQLFAEAWRDGSTTDSSWAPPLWIPYAMLAVGMLLLAVRSALMTASTILGVGRVP